MRFFKLAKNYNRWTFWSQQTNFTGSITKHIFLKYLMWQNFLLQKEVKIENEYQFSNIWTLIIYKFWHSSSHQINFEGSNAKSIFFSVLCEKIDKWKNTFFGYKKLSKFKSYNIFKSANQNLYMFHFYFSLKMGTS